jgi:hypothetical protein
MLKQQQTKPNKNKNNQTKEIYQIQFSTHSITPHAGDSGITL